MLIHVNGTKVFFDVLNAGLDISTGVVRCMRPIVCLPGGPGADHQSLRPFFDRLAPMGQVFYLDPRGTGRSQPGTENDWTLNQWADDLAAFCDALSLHRPIVVGVSAGALIAQAYLARHATQPGAAILINPCARMIKEELIASFGRFGGEAAETAARAMYTTGDQDAILAFIRDCMPLYSRGRSMPSPNSRAGYSFPVSQHFFGPHGDAFCFDHRLALKSTQCPVLAIAGAHDPVTRLEWATEVAQSIPPELVTFEVFSDSSHLVPVDEPDKLLRTIAGFVDRLDRFPEIDRCS